MQFSIFARTIIFPKNCKERPKMIYMIMQTLTIYQDIIKVASYKGISSLYIKERHYALKDLSDVELG